MPVLFCFSPHSKLYLFLTYSLPATNQSRRKKFAIRRANRLFSYPQQANFPEHAAFACQNQRALSVTARCWPQQLLIHRLFELDKLGPFAILPVAFVVPEAAKANGANEKETQATLEQSVRAKLFLVRRDQIEAAFANGQRVDDGVATIDKNDFKKLLKSGGRSWTSVDSMSKSFQFNKPKLLFSGERNPDTGQNLGFYFEVMVYNNNDPNSFTIELRIWNELKIGGDPTDPISLEISVPRKSYLMVSRFVAKDQGFSEEERAFFDSSSSLAALNSEAFSEDFSDLVLVLELK